VKGSIEYAVAELGVSLIMVLGHSGCGAIEAALKHIEARDALAGSNKELASLLQPTVARIKGSTRSSSGSGGGAGPAQGRRRRVRAANRRGHADRLRVVTPPLALGRDGEGLVELPVSRRELLLGAGRYLTGNG
jgi:Carbonic anhydrase